MSRVLVLYGSHHGQTERIARRMREVLERAGHEATALSADAPQALGALERSDAIIVGGAIRMGRHPGYVERLGRNARAAIDARPNAFFSVSLSAHGTERQRGEAEGCVREFIKRTGWQPQVHAIFAGALPYSRYNPFIRFMMRLIVSAAGGDTDTSRDDEYPDWAEVQAFAEAFARRLETQALAA